jgi:tetratricopeptide (TPR) repeat protein
MESVVSVLEPYFERGKDFAVRFWAALGICLVAIEMWVASSDTSPTASDQRIAYGLAVLLAAIVAWYLARRRSGALNCLISARKAYRHGARQFELRDYTSAVQAFSEASRLDPDWHGYANSEGRALLRVGDYAKAVAAFTRAYHAAPSKETCRKFLKNRALANYLSGRPGEAVNDYKEYLAQRPADAIARRLMALSWLAMPGDNIGVAVREARKAVSERGKLGTTHATLAVTLASAGETDAANKELAEAIRRKPTTADSFYALAQAQAALEDFPAARESTLSAIGRDPRFAPRVKADPLMRPLLGHYPALVSEIDEAAKSSQEPDDEETD